MQKQKKWTKLRHKITAAIIYYPLKLATRIIYGYKPEVQKDAKKRQYMIIMNHQTPADQFFVLLTFKTAVYIVGSADLLSKGFISRIFEFFCGPIPIKKSTQDFDAIMNMYKISKEGGSLAIFPEGNRTFTGVPSSIKPSTAKLIKKIGLPIAIMRLEGGYAASPRWCDTKRRIKNGRVRAYVYKILEPEEYKAMSNEDFFKLITDSLYVDETKLGVLAKSKRSAECIERVIYYCPDCGLSSFKSKGEEFWCEKCGRKWKYNEDLTISDATSEQQPSKQFPILSDWFAAQNKFISSLNPSDFEGKEIFSANVELFKVKIGHSTKPIAKNVTFILMWNKYILKKGDDILYELNFDDLEAVTVQGENKLIIYCGEDTFKTKSDKSFNAIRYMNFYYHYINKKSPENSQQEEDEFLGL